MSELLAKVLLVEQFEERRVLEIGCGLALPSIIAKGLGANITASDYHPLTRNFLRKNTKLNSLEGIPYLFGDWNTPNCDLEKFDLIVGSDLLYEAFHVELVARFIDLNLGENGKVIVLDPGRGSHRKFVKAMNRLGFDCVITGTSEFTLRNDSKGFVLRFRRRKDSKKLIERVSGT